MRSIAPAQPVDSGPGFGKAIVEAAKETARTRLRKRPTITMQALPDRDLLTSSWKRKGVSGGKGVIRTGYSGLLLHTRVTKTWENRAKTESMNSRRGLLACTAWEPPPFDLLCAVEHRETRHFTRCRVHERDVTTGDRGA